jgi:rod shape-determining protein MreC
VGSGSLDKLNLIHVPDTADIVVGDLLVTSGLGGRFPSGYPVGRITEVRHDPGLPFAIVSAVPLAQLDRSRHVLLVFSSETDDAALNPEPAESDGTAPDATADTAAPQSEEESP